MLAQSEICQTWAQKPLAAPFTEEATTVRSTCPCQQPRQSRLDTLLVQARWRVIQLITHRVLILDTPNLVTLHQRLAKHHHHRVVMIIPNIPMHPRKFAALQLCPHHLLSEVMLLLQAQEDLRASPTERVDRKSVVVDMVAAEETLRNEKKFFVDLVHLLMDPLQNRLSALAILISATCTMVVIQA